jgi:hypothetical protein
LIHHLLELIYLFAAGNDFIRIYRGILSIPALEQIKRGLIIGGVFRYRKVLFNNLLGVDFRLNSPACRRSFNGILLLRLDQSLSSLQ